MIAAMQIAHFLQREEKQTDFLDPTNDLQTMYCFPGPASFAYHRISGLRILQTVSMHDFTNVGGKLIWA